MHMNRHIHPKTLVSRSSSFFLLIIFTVGLYAGCSNAKPVITGTPTPLKPPTPLPSPITLILTAEPLPVDALGCVISSSDHFFSLYLSFGDLRVYEYETSTFLDAVCVNAYPLPLDGELHIVYYTSEGKICGTGQIFNARGNTKLETGSNTIYAEILTDIDVRGMDFVWEIVSDYLPVEVE